MSYTRYLEKARSRHLTQVREWFRYNVEASEMTLEQCGTCRKAQLL
jgi:hypothetical protein